MTSLQKLTYDKYISMCKPWIIVQCMSKCFIDKYINENITLNHIKKEDIANLGNIKIVDLPKKICLSNIKNNILQNIVRNDDQLLKLNKVNNFMEALKVLVNYFESKYSERLYIQYSPRFFKGKYDHLNVSKISDIRGSYILKLTEFMQYSRYINDIAKTIGKLFDLYYPDNKARCNEWYYNGEPIITIELK